MGSFDALGTAIYGLQAQSLALQNISSNIANTSTTAFKSTDTSFEDFVDTTDGPGTQPSGFTQVLSRYNNDVQGTIQTSSISTYMAIKGDGYFTVEKPSVAGGSPSTVAYTRRGDFQLDGNGYLVNGAGYYLMGTPIDPVTGATTGGALQPLKFDTTTPVPNLGTLKSLSINSKGQIEGTYSNGQTVSVAALPLATFNGQDFLQQQDGGAFTPTPDSGAASYDASGTIVGNALEASNADVETQMTNMIQVQQAYTATSKVVTISDEMLRTLTNLTI